MMAQIEWSRESEVEDREGTSPLMDSAKIGPTIPSRKTPSPECVVGMTLKVREKRGQSRGERGRGLCCWLHLKSCGNEGEDREERSSVMDSAKIQKARSCWPTLSLAAARKGYGTMTLHEAMSSDAVQGQRLIGDQGTWRKAMVMTTPSFWQNFHHQAALRHGQSNCSEEAWIETMHVDADIDCARQIFLHCMIWD